MFAIIKKLILPFIVIVGAFVLYSIFIKEDPSTSLLTKETATSGDVLGADIIKAINQIKALTLSRDIFDDPSFKTLVDRSEVLKPEPVGRVNPFAPVSGSGTASTTPARITR